MVGGPRGRGVVRRDGSEGRRKGREGVKGVSVEERGREGGK